jgi:hypothetical protein
MCFAQGEARLDAALDRITAALAVPAKTSQEPKCQAATED